jgi:hypothetical protein
MSPKMLMEEMSNTSSLKLISVMLALEKLMPGKVRGPKSVPVVAWRVVRALLRRRALGEARVVVAVRRVRRKVVENILGGFGGRLFVLVR